MGYISKTLEDAIRETLDKKQQIMLFINRRGHSPIVQCKKCGWAASCPDCSAGLNYHKKSGTLLCHICGWSIAIPKKCPDCGNDITFMGAGVEKVEEEVFEKFPNAKTAIVSSDTVSSNKSLESLINKIESHEIDIIIGTQILAKGHHFPNLTLVGVIDADSGLYGTDFRAAEKTFQQLFQVSGRAGRGDEPGRVILQTYQPDHPVIKALAESNRDDFVSKDLENRRLAKMPPYGQLIAIIVESKDENTLIDFCKSLSNAAPIILGGKIFGPIPSEMYQIRGWYRNRFLVSGPENSALQPIVAGWLSKVKKPSTIRLKIDVSPHNFI